MQNADRGAFRAIAEPMRSRSKRGMGKRAPIVVSGWPPYDSIIDFPSADSGRWPACRYSTTPANCRTGRLLMAR